MYKLDKKSLEIIYKSVIRSQIDYGSIIYNNSPTKDLEKLDKLHYEAVRIIIRSTKNHWELKLKMKLIYKHHWKDIGNYFTLCQVYVLFYNLGPSILNNIWDSSFRNKLFQLNI